MYEDLIFFEFLSVRSLAYLSYTIPNARDCMDTKLSIYIIEFCPSGEALLFSDWLPVAEEKRSRHTHFASPKSPFKPLHGWLALITYSKGRRGREAFSIHPSRHPSMDGIIQGRKPWQK
jgi:hypothetical protein